MSVIDWALYSERAVGRGSLTYTDVINRPLREVMTISGQDPDASFPGFSLAGHTHDASAVVSGTLAPARGGTGLSSPAAGSLLVAAAAAAMTLLAPGASGQVVRSNGTAWAAAAIVSADISDAASINTPSKVVIRDASGNFVAGTITAALTGNASTASALATARAINGVNFDGTAPITVRASTTNALTIGAHLTGSSFDGSAPITIATDATAANTTSTIVARDGSGNFAAGVITASFTGALTGNASTATKLAAAVNINGVAFDGSGAVTVPAAANTLTGTTLASNVVSSSLTGVGILTSGTWQATIVAPAFGGTGVANASTITLGGNVNTAAAFTTVGGALTLTVTGATNVTLPTSGTLVNTAVTTLSSLNSVGTIGTGVWNATPITDAFLATISTASKVATGAVAPGTFAVGAFAFQGAVSGITTLATSGAINGQTISSAASFTGSVTIAGATTAALVTLSNAVQLPGNGSAGLQARNAANTAYVDLLFMNASDVAVIPRALSVSSTLTIAAATTIQTGGLTISAGGLVVSANGVVVAAGTTAVQALTATTGVFSSNIIATRFSTTLNNSAALVVQNAAGHNTGLIGNRLDITGSGSADDAIVCAFGTIGLVPGNGTVSALTVNTDLSTSFAGDIKVAAAKKVFLDGGSDTYLQESSANVILAIAGGNNGIQIDGSSAPTSAQTRLSVAVGGGIGLQPVTLGAADSGGVGFKLLRVPN